MVVYSASEFKSLHNFHNLTQEINRLSSEVFNHTVVNDNVGMLLNENGYIGYLTMNNMIVACGFAGEDTFNDTSKYKTLYIHTFGVHRDYRGKGLCQQIVKEFINKFGRNHVLYLTVRTESGNVNESAIRCYQNNDFIMLPEVYRDHYDGKNSAMIRLPTTNRNKNKSGKIKKKKKKKKKTNRRN